MIRFKTLPLLLVFGCVAVAQDTEGFKVSVSLDLVALQTTVRDKKGVPISDLREQDFQVFEDNVRQSLRLFRHEDIPVTVGLVVDHSGSMRRKLPDVTTAARTFVKFSSPQDEMFVVNFNENVTMGLPDGVNFSDDPYVLANAIAAPAAGETALYDAIFVALDRLKSGGHDKKVLIIISDGGDNKSTHTQAEALKAAAQSGALIYTIGIYEETDRNRNLDVLRRLAQASGGEAYFPTQVEDVITVCERIAREIRNQYVLGYVSSNASQPGVFHTVKVVAGEADKKLQARTRTGYVAK